MTSKYFKKYALYEENIRNKISLFLREKRIRKTVLHVLRVGGFCFAILMPFVVNRKKISNKISLFLSGEFGTQIKRRDTYLKFQIYPRPAPRVWSKFLQSLSPLKY